MFCVFTLYSIRMIQYFFMYPFLGPPGALFVVNRFGASRYIEISGSGLSRMGFEACVYIQASRLVCIINMQISFFIGFIHFHVILDPMSVVIY